MPLTYDGQKKDFDITIPCEVNSHIIPDYRALAELLNQVASNWVFQKEQGDQEDYVHWQVRLSLHKKVVVSTLYKEILPTIPGHWSLTANNTREKGNQFCYVMKVHTRIEGPWSDKDHIKPAPVMTDQLQRFMDLEPYPWQTDLKAIATSYHERHLHYIYDPHYNSGKSIAAEWLEYLELAEEIPGIFTLAEDVMQYAMSMPKARCYIFDMPAAMKKEKVSQLYSGLEMLKNGFLFDKRYAGRKMRISRPMVICFANNLPNLGLMAPDRWIIKYITPDKELVNFDSTIHPYI